MPEGLPVSVDLVAYRGNSWSQLFRFLEAGTPVDLSEAEIASWACLNGSTEVLTIAGDHAAGEVSISWPSSGPLGAGRWDYDLEVVDAGTTKTWVRGTLAVAADVTNAPG